MGSERRRIRAFGRNAKAATVKEEVFALCKGIV